MKTKSKALLLVLCAVLLIAASIWGTMAYLTSTSEVKNTFSVGSVAIKLDEALANADGSLVPNANRVQGNSYKLLPGHTYHKDPMVTVLAGSEEAYIKMTVTISKFSQFDAIGISLISMFEGYDPVNWIYKGSKQGSVANTHVYEFWYKETVAAPDADVPLDPLFDKLAVPGSINSAQLASIDGMTITVNAYAIQKAGFETASAAWEAYAG